MRRVDAVLVTVLVATVVGCSADQGDPSAFCDAWQGADLRGMLRAAPTAIDDEVGTYVARQSRGDPVDDARQRIEDWVAANCDR